MDILGSQQQQQQDIPPEVLEQLMQEQQGQYASGGPVGRPEDTYYFTVEDIQGMMQEPDPMVQQVGAGLAQQMAPGMGAVPATPSQLQMMAQGGQPLYRENGGRTNLLTTDPERDMRDEYFDEVVVLEEGENVDPFYLDLQDYLPGEEGLHPWELREKRIEDRRTKKEEEERRERDWRLQYPKSIPTGRTPSDKDMEEIVVTHRADGGALEPAASEIISSMGIETPEDLLILEPYLPPLEPGETILDVVERLPIPVLRNIAATLNSESPKEFISEAANFIPGVSQARTGLGLLKTMKENRPSRERTEDAVPQLGPR
jgi:hypothetical protein